MTANNAPTFPEIPDYTPDHASLLRKAISVVKNIMHGKTNNVFPTTLDPSTKLVIPLSLTANSATTTVSLPTNELGLDTMIVFFPTTSNAAVELASGAMWVSARTVTGTTPTFTITHTNNAQTDRNFRFALIG